MRNALLLILSFSILLTGFSQAFDILSFQVQKYYVSNDHQDFVKSNLIYCGGESVLKKKLNDHEKSSGTATAGKKDIQLFREHDITGALFIPATAEDLFIPSHIGNITRRPSSIFHPPSC